MWQLDCQHNHRLQSLVGRTQQWDCMDRFSTLLDTKSPCSSTGVTVHAAVCSVCDPQSGRLDALLSERADGQINAHLPGTQHCASVICCLMLECPSSQMHGEHARNSFFFSLPSEYAFSVLQTNPLCMAMCVGGERSVCVLCSPSHLLHHRGGEPGPLP